MRRRFDAGWGEVVGAVTAPRRKGDVALQTQRLRRDNRRLYEERGVKSLVIPHGLGTPCFTS
ncbi:hypothetical protein [Pyrobaculum aerophilum]|uniref:Uncharacterized protein n=1 Tax=Pyrobaculum aerophilum TaxID=13773 RepID=A0A832WHA1_9CREN|nr:MULTISPECIES: hypothetical protein [Pyrobaculum]MCX8135613.1 hypothetical protein [Pyrobaculum aerophilum]HII47305.1 hypothetical protein [Pyrobaculum aerophilum]